MKISLSGLFERNYSKVSLSIPEKAHLLLSSHHFSLQIVIRVELTGDETSIVTNKLVNSRNGRYTLSRKRGDLLHLFRLESPKVLTYVLLIFCP